MGKKMIKYISYDIYFEYLMIYFSGGTGGAGGMGDPPFSEMSEVGGNFFVLKFMKIYVF